MRKFVCLILQALLMVSCATVKEKESFSEQHMIESMIHKMDSLISKSSTVTQDSLWKETFLHELEKIREKNDTSHTVVVDTAGNVIRERIEIWHERESTSEKDLKEREFLMHRLEKMDSVMQISSLQTSRIDSLVQQLQKEKTVVKDKPWYQKLFDHVRYVAFGIVTGIILIVVALLLTRKWWKRFIKLS